MSQSPTQLLFAAIPLAGISHACFGLSYLLALGAEGARLRWPQPAWRYGALVCGALGLFAQTLYLAHHQPNAAHAGGSLLLLTWVLGIFYFYGALHRTRTAWAIFVLPLILALVALSYLLTEATLPLATATDPDSQRLGGIIHGALLLCAAIGISVGFLASIMYHVQAARLRAKANPLGGVRLFSLERLESMNRRAVNLAFPFLTAGLLLGILLTPPQSFRDYFHAKVLGTAGLWLVFLVLLYARYGAQASGRQLATFTIVAFLLMLLSLVAAHPFAGGAGP
ncbi:MAG: cytochrome c biogenesis protein CcsA [Gemmataceae bacterium]